MTATQLRTLWAVQVILSVLLAVMNDGWWRVGYVIAALGFGLLMANVWHEAKRGS